MHDVTLFIGDRRYGNLTTVCLRASIDEVAQSFTASYVQSAEKRGEQVRIDEGTAVEVEIDGEPWCTGYVDDSEECYAKGQHTLTITGRAKTGDLVDCTAIYKSGLILKKSLLDIATLLCKPFGIGVTLDRLLILDGEVTEKVPRFKLDEGETVFEALTRLTRKRGIILTTTPTGDLLLTRATRTPTVSIIRNGVNVLSATYTGTWRDRFSAYTFKSQMASDDDWNGLSATQIKHVATDAAVNATGRYRPITISAEHGDTRAKMKTRALWERNQRAGKSQQMCYTVEGWEGLDGFWKQNTMPLVTDDILGVSDSLLVMDVELSRDDKGAERTTMHLCQRAAYDVLEEPKLKRKKR